MQTCTGPAQQMQVSRMQSLAAEELRNFKPSQHHPGSHTVSKLPSYRANTVLSRKQRQKQRWTVAASRSGQEPKGPKDVKSIRRLPIFPLQVAMPFVPCALNIFEARYRVLFNTLLFGAEGLDEGLVNQNSPFCGSRTFGMCLITPEGLTSVGTTLHIDQHLLRGDGQMSVTSQGKERFKIQNVVEQKPVLICDVEMLQGDDTQSLIAQDIASEVRRLFKELIALNSKISAKQVVADDLTSPELDASSPEQLSFVIASMFSMNPFLQQSLLEEGVTLNRLRKERDLLQNTLNYQSATSALKSAFESPTAAKPQQAEASSSSSAATPPSSPTEASDKGPAQPSSENLAAEELPEKLPESEDKQPPASGPD